MARRQIGSFFVKYPDGWRSLGEGLSGESSRIPSRGALLLFPFCTASVHPFSFPFRSPKDVRNALSLKFRPLLAAEEEVEIAPFVTGGEKGGSEGVVWCLSRSEVPDEKSAPSVGNHVAWPLPLALASTVNGEGIAVFRNETFLASAVFRNGIPVFSRCRAADPEDGGIEAEVDWCRRYAAGEEGESASRAVWTGTGDEDLLLAARRTVNQFPALLEINVSRPALQASLARERTALILGKASAWAAAAGLLFCLVQFSFLSRAEKERESFSRQSVALFSEVMGEGEKIVDPLSQARGKLAGLKGSGMEKSTLSMLLSHLGKTWMGGGDSRKADFPVLEQIRWSGDGGAELSGSSSAMESIHSLRAAAEAGGYRASLGDIQQVPGGGLRFSLSLRRDGH